MNARRPLLLDLFCGAGGAARGYHDAGFEVVGVDIAPQPRYPYEFIQADVLDVLTWPAFLRSFDVVHASPPCQAYSVSRNNGCHAGAPMLIASVRDALRAAGVVYVIENVAGARKHMLEPALLCGAYFGLGAAGMQLPRHRLFETNFGLRTPGCVHDAGRTLGVYGHGANKWHRELIGRNIYQHEKRAAMGIDWMNRAELSESIPPAYTRFIGRQLLAHLTSK